jgi:hypothetical protein
MKMHDAVCAGQAQERCGEARHNRRMTKFFAPKAAHQYTLFVGKAAGFTSFGGSEHMHLLPGGCQVPGQILGHILLAP